MKTKSFTLLEMIIVIVVIGIISVAFLSKNARDPLYEAALQVVEHIRYTQHLALIHDPYSLKNPQWYKERWQIVFGTNKNSDYKPAYTIFSDKGKHSGDPSSSEIAKNPANVNLLMCGGYTGSKELNVVDPKFKGMKVLNLGLTYGVTSYKLEDGCSGARISFDFLGRPLKGDSRTLRGPYQAGTKRLISKDCHILLTSKNRTIVITVKAESGYTYIEKEI